MSNIYSANEFSTEDLESREFKYPSHFWNFEPVTTKIWSSYIGFLESNYPAIPSEIGNAIMANSILLELTENNLEKILITRNIDIILFNNRHIDKATIGGLQIYASDVLEKSIFLLHTPGSDCLVHLFQSTEEAFEMLKMCRFTTRVFVLDEIKEGLRHHCTQIIKEYIRTTHWKLGGNSPL
jgi:hypothetical protein